jgi:signal transduction histidine kinase
MMALYYANIVSSHSELELEVKRHLQTAREFGEATEEAQRAVRAKSEFLSNMSHELRTPLNAIIGFSEMLMDETAPDDQSFADLQAINGAGYRLLGLINELLDLSKLEAGKMELHVEPFPLSKLVDEIAQEWCEPIAENGNEFRVDCAADLGEVVGDAAKLRRAVSNLLSNAAKYTRGGRVTLAVSNEGGRVMVAVSDTGPGISADRMLNIFETFGKHDGETSSIYRDDPGLGLPLGQRLCRLMNGELTADSELGRGSCFTIRIPSQPPKHEPSNTAESDVFAVAVLNEAIPTHIRSEHLRCVPSTLA